MPDSSEKKISHPYVERTLWISLTSVLVVVIVLLLVFAFPGFLPKSNQDILPADASKKETPTTYATRMEKIYKLILSKYLTQVEPADLYRAAVKGMVQFLDDPYTELVEKSSASGISDTIQGEFAGVGLVISKFKDTAEDKKDTQKTSEKESQDLYVVSPIEGTPAYQAGIHAGDYITAIDGKPTNVMSTEEAMQSLRGKVGTSVKMQIRRADSSFDVEIKRAKIEVETAKSTKIGDLGYIRMIQFTSKLPLRVYEALEQFRTDSIKGLIIDLRGNPGGSLEAVLEIAGYFLGKDDTVVSTSSRSKNEEIHYMGSSDTVFDKDMPIVVLVDKGSASASEILAGALQSHKRATIIGTATYGKAKVQQIYPLKNDNSEFFKLTVARYLTPSGKNIDSDGIIPDVEMKSPYLNNEQDIKDWVILAKARSIETFLTQNPSPTAQQIRLFITQERRRLNIQLSNQNFLYLINVEKDRRLDPIPIYNLDNDPILRSAIQTLTKAKP